MVINEGPSLDQSPAIITKENVERELPQKKAVEDSSTVHSDDMGKKVNAVTKKMIEQYERTLVEKEKFCAKNFARYRKVNKERIKKFKSLDHLKEIVSDQVIHIMLSNEKRTSLKYGFQYRLELSTEKGVQFDTRFVRMISLDPF